LMKGDGKDLQKALKGWPAHTPHGAQRTCRTPQRPRTGCQWTKWVGGTLQNGREHGRGIPRGKRGGCGCAPLLLAAGASHSARVEWGRLRVCCETGKVQSQGAPGQALTGPSSIPWPSGCLLENPSNTLLQTQTLDSPVPQLCPGGPRSANRCGRRPPTQCRMPASGREANKTAAQTLHRTIPATTLGACRPLGPFCAQTLAWP
jgi:hypothetical protein